MPNPATQELSLSNVISITILPTPQNLGVPNINTAALITQDQPSWAEDQEFKIYTNASDVAADFSFGSNAAAIAAAFFAQMPNPLSTAGYLTIIPRLIATSETVQEAIVRTLSKVYYFGVLVDTEYNADASTFETLATYIQTLDKIFFYASSHAEDYAPAGLLDNVRLASETHTRALYYNKGEDAIDTPAFAAAYAGRALSTDFSGSNTTTTLHLKQLAGVTPDQTMDQTALVACQAAGVDVYVSVAGVPGLFTSGENSFFDLIYNEFWFKFALQAAGFNYLAGTGTKVPQTETGMEGLKNIYRAVCEQAKSNAFIGPGSWTSPDTFGDPASLVRSVKDHGYYVYSAPITAQLQADRAARIAPLVQIAVKTQGAIHRSSVIVNVNL
jgi:hypothetical protein